MKENSWREVVGFCGCIYPCSGQPKLRTKPGKVALEADYLPAYLQCSECGYTPVSKIQPKLVKRFLKTFVKAKDDGNRDKRKTSDE